MRHLNYTHLLYFWTVATEGSVTRAAEVLNLTPQTISGQIKLLEDTVGEALFNRVGRGLAVTETGQVVKQYADEIFALGAELTQRVKSQQTLVPTTVNVGIVDSIPKLVALRVLEPVFSMEDPIKIVCTEGSFDSVLAELSVHRLDLVISNRVLPPGTGVRAYNHLLGTSSMSLFAHRSIARKHKTGFPGSLDGEPMLLPQSDNPVRRGLDEWMDERKLSPKVVAEFDDSGLLKAFGEAALGVFPAPTAIAESVTSMYHAVNLGETSVTESYYAISTERKIRHPAIRLVTESARTGLFS